MKVLIIDKPVSRLIMDLAELLTITKGPAKKVISYKIKLAKGYRDRKEVNVEVNKIKANRAKSESTYTKKMKALVKEITGISYAPRDDTFYVRVKGPKGQVYLGTFKELSDAQDVLGEYFKGLDDA